MDAETHKVAVGDKFTATRVGGPKITREFEVIKVTPAGWLRCESRAVNLANGTTKKLRQAATFKQDGSVYSTRRRSDTWAPHWVAKITQ